MHKTSNSIGRGWKIFLVLFLNSQAHPEQGKVDASVSTEQASDQWIASARLHTLCIWDNSLRFLLLRDFQSSHWRKLFAKIFFWEQGEEVWATAFGFSSEDQFPAVCFLYAVTIFLFFSSLWNPFKSILVFGNHCPQNCREGWSLSQPFLLSTARLHLKLSVKALNSCWSCRVHIASLMALRNFVNRICN